MKRLELISVNSDRTIPIGSLGAAIIMTQIDENAVKEWYAPLIDKMLAEFKS